MWEVYRYRWIVLLVVLGLLAYTSSLWVAILVGIPAAAIMIGRSVYFVLRRATARPAS